MLFPPSSYPGDPVGHAENQAGHMAVGVALAVAALGTVPAAWAWAACGFAYWLVWERLWQRGKLHRDSAEDAVFVTCGAGVACLLFVGDWGGAAGAVLATGALLLVGVWRRG